MEIVYRLLLTGNYFFFRTVSNLLPGRSNNADLDDTMDRETDPNEVSTSSWKSKKSSSREDIQYKLIALLEKEISGSGGNEPKQPTPANKKDHVSLQLASFEEKIRSFPSDHQERVLFELHHVLHRYADNLRRGVYYNDHQHQHQHQHFQGGQGGQHSHRVPSGQAPHRTSSATATVSSPPDMTTPLRERVLGFDEW